ncbi:MAG: 7,8-didemethyl-8-hydroxy-5-deazariboflavin synthase CofG [Candidatus Binatia bacterium]|nr:7,8-didemethyl-8-hydroxy-5-deazariboflavin synthase CofG [Candidatus Binatia bacterium]MDG2010643.1 7,8-didemethyl-8-hydroxy-5-deazariboflavin synthase CofG [Candidatus Binatia bacterium]
MAQGNPQMQTGAAAAPDWQPISRREAIRALSATGEELEHLLKESRTLRDAGKGRVVTYSPKAFFPVTNLCRDRCAYCTFRRDEDEAGAWTMQPEEIRSWSERAESLGCIEALMCLGDRPEDNSPRYREWLRSEGMASTIEYVGKACDIALEQGLLPHSNPGLMGPEDYALLKPSNVSLGMMLESVSPKLRQKGEVHYYAPDKDPEKRLRVLEDAGEAQVPFTTGILLGIGESLEDRVDSLLAIADTHNRHGHIQEIIIQNFRAKPEIPMAGAAEPDTLDLVRTIVVARLLTGPKMNIQVPPNLSDASSLPPLLESGINDLGGISPLTPDYVNPEAPWPHLGALERACAAEGFELRPRLPIYDEFINRPGFLDKNLAEPVRIHQRAVAQRGSGKGNEGKAT